MNFLDQFRDIEFNEPASWPGWFTLMVASLVGLLLVFGGWHFLIKDQLTTLGTQQRQEVELRKTFKNKKGMVINLPAYREQMVQVETLLSMMVNQLPDSTEVPSLLVDITRVGKRRGLEFVVFDPLKEEQHDFYAVLPIRVEISGRFHQVALFISDLSMLPRIVTVGDMAIDADDAGNLKTSILLQTYRYQTEEG